MHENAIVYLLLVVFLIGMMLRAVELSVTFFLVKDNLGSYRCRNELKTLSPTIAHQYAAFTSFSYLYYFFNCLTSFRLTTVKR